MFSIILNKVSFYFLMFVLSFAILLYVTLIVEENDDSSSRLSLAVQKITMMKPPPKMNSVAELSVKEIVFMDNVPVKTGRLSSKYGIRKDPFNGRKRMHHGIDIAAQRGTNIYPLGRGEVLFSGRKSGYGNMVEILHGDAIISRYAHIKKLLVKKGQIVNKGDIIALVGNTGRSTGPHLHLEIAINGETVDPEIFLIGNVAYK
ncbi:MAG TPA: M23 family metallopeptidase [Leucothrix mucor]|uniref:M23 family metallopeptidase n=1 Tax=Leucothrix mucor TaxID=45248 RepID=A0A7V2T037_LEUMU|nr:M23 family metallopeptidase [Leucothrix mucor]